MWGEDLNDNVIGRMGERCSNVPQGAHGDE